MSDFINITEQEFKDWAEQSLESPEYLLPSRGKELVIRQKNFIKSFELHIYTSLVSGKTRDIGGDSIHVILYDGVSIKPIGGTKRIHRTEGSTTVWERLEIRLEELRLLGDQQVVCPKCKSHMMKRVNGRTGETFYGCSAFPKCPRGEKLNRTYPLVTLDTHSDSKKEHKVLEDKLSVDLFQIELVEEKDCFSTDIYSFQKYSFKNFNRVQSTILKHNLYKKDINLVLGTSTSSGKTVCAELFMGEVLAKKEIVLYVSPLKSLTEEKKQDWEKTFGKKGYNICILTGDYILSPRKSEELNKANIIVLTSEMLDSRSRKKDSEKSFWMKKVGLIILDESHIISTSRGHAVEVGLMRFSKIVPQAKILCLSATMPNVEDFRKWLINLNGKKTEVINSSWRPTKLTWEYYLYDAYLKYREQQNSKIDKVLEIIKSKSDEHFLCFVHDKNSGRILESRIKSQGIDTCFHNADLDLESRLEIERKFKARKDGIRVLISTSTLAWGSIEQDTNILMLSGLEKKVQELKEGDEIISFNENNNTKDQDMICGITKYNPSEVYEIELEDDRILRVDYKHPFYVKEGKGFKIAKAENLKEGDNLFVFEDLT